MTRDQAIDIVKVNMEFVEGEWIGLSPRRIVDILSDLGLLKVETPKTPTERALKALNAWIKTYLSLHRNDPIPTGEVLIGILQNAGVRIVEK